MIQDFTRYSPIFVSLCIVACIGSLAHAQDGVDCSYRGYLGSYQPVQSNEFIELIDVAVVDQIVYTASYGDEFAGLVATDIADPTNPIMLGSLSIEIDESMVVQDGYAYCISFDGTILIVDISDPSSLNTVSSIELIDRAKIYGINGNTLLAGRGQTLFLVDVSDPRAPDLIIEYTASSDIQDAEIHNNLAVLLYQSGIIETLDITDPANPSLLSSYQTAISRLGHITISENQTLYAINRDQLSVIDLSAPHLPVEVSQIALIDLLGDMIAFEMSDIEIDSSVLGITFGVGGLFTVDVQDPNNIVLIGNLSTPGYAWNLELDGGFGYIADLGAGLTIVEIDELNAINPKIGELYSKDSSPFNPIVADGIAYIGDSSLGSIQIVDVSDPALPTLLSTYPIDTDAWDNFAIKDSFIFLPNNGSGLHIVDARDPNDPQLATIAIPSFSTDWIAIENNLAYVITGDEGVLVTLDILDPAKPVLEGIFSIEEFDTSHLMTIKDQMLHLYKDIRGTQEPTKLFVYDITDRNEPAFAGEVELGQSRLDALIISEEYIYAGSHETLYIIERAGLTLVNTVQTFDTINSLEIMGDRLYAGIEFGRFNVYDISIPEQPRYLSSTMTSSDVFGIDVVDSLAYLAINRVGLVIINVSSGCSDCAADITGDGVLDILDVLEFLKQFAAHDQVADFDSDGRFNFFDVSAFLSAFSAGCP